MNPKNPLESQQGDGHLFVQAMDSESGLALCEVYLGQFSVSKIAGLINCKASEFKPNNPVYIEDEQLENLRSGLGVYESDLVSVLGEHRPKGSDLGILIWSPRGGSLPYRLHTGRELLLMKNGDKPLSAFVGRIPADESFVEIPEYLFDRYVEDGLLVKREMREMQDRPFRGIEGHRIVLYARKGEEWRLDAYALIRSLANKIGWSEPLIRLEGTLLGYDDCQNDAYIAQMKASESAR